MKRNKIRIKDRKYSSINNSDAQNKKKKRRIIIETIIYIFEISLVVGLAYFLINHGFIKSSMNGDSMSVTLENGNEVIINKMIYKFFEPKRNDVVAYCRTSEHSTLSIKRIIGLPGEKIQIRDGMVYINGEQLIEDIEVEPMKTGGLAQEELELEDNEYFLLGDNRNNSDDSRFSEIGTIVKNEIIGKVWIRTDSFSIVN